MAVGVRDSKLGAVTLVTVEARKKGNVAVYSLHADNSVIEGISLQAQELTQPDKTSR